MEPYHWQFSRMEGGADQSHIYCCLNLGCKINVNKTKVLSVQLGKTLGPTNAPITETEENTQVRKKFFLKCF